MRRLGWRWVSGLVPEPTRGWDRQARDSSQGPVAALPGALDAGLATSRGRGTHCRPGCSCGCILGRHVCDGRRSSGSWVPLRFARAAPGQRLRIEPQVGGDLLDRGSLHDGRDALQVPAAADRAVPRVDVEDVPEQPRPADAMRPGLNRLGIASGGGRSFDGLPYRRGHSGPWPCGTTRARRFALGLSPPSNDIRQSRGDCAQARRLGVCSSSLGSMGATYTSGGFRSSRID